MLAILGGSIIVSDGQPAITFSSGEQASVFVVRYAGDKPLPEVRRSADGQLLATLRGPVAVDRGGR